MVTVALRLPLVSSVFQLGCAPYTPGVHRAAEHAHRRGAVVEAARVLVGAPAELALAWRPAPAGSCRAQSSSWRNASSAPSSSVMSASWRGRWSSWVSKSPPYGTCTTRMPAPARSSRTVAASWAPSVVSGYVTVDGGDRGDEVAEVQRGADALAPGEQHRRLGAVLLAHGPLRGEPRGVHARVAVARGTRRRCTGPATASPRSAPTSAGVGPQPSDTPVAASSGVAMTSQSRPRKPYCGNTVPVGVAEPPAPQHLEVREVGVGVADTLHQRERAVVQRWRGWGAGRAGR